MCAAQYTHGALGRRVDRRTQCVPRDGDDCCSQGAAPRLDGRTPRFHISTDPVALALMIRGGAMRSASPAACGAPGASLVSGSGSAAERDPPHFAARPSQGWHHWGERDMQLLMRIADILVVNYALHYDVDVRKFAPDRFVEAPCSPRVFAHVIVSFPYCDTPEPPRALLQMGGHFTTYQEQMRSMLDQVDEFSKTPGKARCAGTAGAPPPQRQACPEQLADRRPRPQAFVWRETAMEHEFYYSRKEEERLPEEDRYTGCRCHASRGKLHDVGGRVEAMAALLRERPAVPVVPMYQLTLPARDMHEGIWCARGGTGVEGGEGSADRYAHCGSVRRRRAGVRGT